MSIKTDGDIKREKIVNSILNTIDDKSNIPDKKTISIINKKFPETKNYVYIDRNNIEVGNLIFVVSLDLSISMIPAVVVNKNGSMLTMYNNYKDSFWKIQTYKYHTFLIENIKTRYFRKIMLEYKKLMKKENE